MEQQNKIPEELVLKLREAFKVWQENLIKKLEENERMKQVKEEEKSEEK